MEIITAAYQNCFWKIKIE